MTAIVFVSLRLVVPEDHGSAADAWLAPLQDIVFEQGEQLEITTAAQNIVDLIEAAITARV